MDQENKKASWILWIGLAVPVIALIFVAIFSYMPSNLVAKYDFIYFERDYNYNCNHDAKYVVSDNKVEYNVSTTTTYDGKVIYCFSGPKVDDIYYYNIKTDKVTRMSLDEAQKLKIDNSRSSPDGISIQNGTYRNNGVFEIFGSNNNNYRNFYLKNKDDEFKKVDLGMENYYNFVLIGWVI